uniref:acyltransferase family protein n=1 Tax=Cellvibrio fontiphilus TaxID=1815559 RepID=UPI002B4C0054|nr:acyltransferase [Cellvibrio fontiphilus]
MTSQQASDRPADQPGQFLPALTGIRFIAILHIFCFHLWVLFDMKKEPGMENLLRDIQDLPGPLVTAISNGWMSTSFFFLLSGFILAYLYWGEHGQLSIAKKTFWFARAIRIYPIHLIVMLITLLMTTGYQLSLGNSPSLLLASGLATITLTQAWFPDFVPIWSWPTWTISALVFLYALLPFLLPLLAKLSRPACIQLLCALPFISLIPTAIYAQFFPAGTEAPLFWKIFIGSTPLFWLAHFVAGILLTRLVGITRAKQLDSNKKPGWFAWGDLALVAVIAIACTQEIAEPFKFFLRHGLMMPLYMIIIVDLARGKGLAARIFSLPLMGFLGETGFSIFIWQNVVMMLCGAVIMFNPDAGQHQFLWALAGAIVLGIFSTYLIEKPVARKLRRKWLPPSQTKHHNSPAPETVAVLPAAPIATGSRHE